ncbi:Branched-chain-amino-acid aminotransferase-like protein [Melia azedarach]|uniref:Branched-chain-amino-acid aminotransferase-like protein n=1 Tax=Melia azedarach TaxID=155640 RepID=A0ACC1Y8A4_MELAZ|nr:Branched-chain-amino-acid aminotransferase-like protein [Melia azedarach]
MTWKCLMNLSVQLFFDFTGFDRPYREELLSKMESDGNKIVKEVIFGPGGKKYRFCKHMAKHRVPGLPDRFMKKGKHIILIRNPLDILSEFDEVAPPSFKELGFADLVTIYSELSELGKDPIIVDEADLQQDPEAILRSLCEDLGIPFQATMLRWEAGPKTFDGVWAQWGYAYESAHKSTGFPPAREYPAPFPFSLYELLEQNLPFYKILRCHVRKTSSLLKTPFPEPDLPVPANKNLLAWVGDEIVTRNDAKVSVFDSIVQGGDGVWEGLRVYNGKIFKLEEHLDRLFDSAKALAFINVPTREEVEGNNANAADAIMLDKDGYVSETNATNIFLVKKGRVLTPHADYCLPGITRATVMDLVVREKFILEERRISLSEFHTADEVWTTGTMGELSPVVKIDGRLVGDGKVGPVTRRLQQAYKNLTEESGVPIPTYKSIN